MFLFKTSGKTFQSVVSHQKHAFRGKPNEWLRGEYVLVSKNRLDCAPGERQIQYLMRLDQIRRLRPGESESYWPGTEGRWRYLVECRDTRAIQRPFDLKEALGAGADYYSPVMTYKRFSLEHEQELREFLAHRQPELIA